MMPHLLVASAGCLAVIAGTAMAGPIISEGEHLENIIFSFFGMMALAFAVAAFSLPPPDQGSPEK